ncbi:hypothetical protein BDV95DRAFT_500951 [Massariosphaeria phaeospora]|uniref:Uncharacterized protein n=1 Tax=Massariosphaeria phaeospora TaxID=100035 RepID=A0A7C8M4B7_9PLEO|nr:hypothetical protein BDV95DRAFT_500951 [Massariosphaeria phaeospora]
MSSKNEQTKLDVAQKNVFHKPLIELSSTQSASTDLPATTIKTGFCTDSAPIAATLTNAFLDFSAKSGLDLRQKGVGPGERWCIEAARWKDAMDSKIEDMPRVKLDSTHVKALDSVGMDVLQKFQAGQELGKAHEVPGKSPSLGKVARESSQIGGKEPKA